MVTDYYKTRSKILVLINLSSFFHRLFSYHDLSSKTLFLSERLRGFSQTMSNFLSIFNKCLYQVPFGLSDFLQLSYFDFSTLDLLSALCTTRSNNLIFLVLRTTSTSWMSKNYIHKLRSLSLSR